jgi:hypothetical protein
MREADWTFILHWAPSLGAAFILAIWALILHAQERRSKREGDSGTAPK